MAKKVILKDLDNVEILPLTRGELILDSSGKEAFHSNEFLATTSLPGLMSPEEKAKLYTIAGNTIDDVLSTTSTNSVLNKVVTAAVNEAKQLANDAQETADEASENVSKVLQIINSIKESYLKSATVNGNTLTITDQSDSEINFVNTTYDTFLKETAASTGGRDGLVPKPNYNSGSKTRFLREDGTWIVPTDTKNTAGSTNSASKLFLIGAASQGANLQTYSNSSVYTTNGTLYATTFVGALSGNATSATKVYINNSSYNVVFPVIFTNIEACGSPRNDSLYVDTASGAGYNPGNNAFVATLFTATNSNGAVALLASTNRGVYDSTNSAWIIYLTQAADHVYVPKWASKGSSTQPVYFNSSGEPVACTAYSGLFTALTSTATTNLSVTIGGTTKSITKLYSGYLKILDVRSTNHLPNAADIYPEYNITAWFNNTGTPTSDWYSGITVRGWHSSYAVWQLACYAGTGTANSYNLYLRNGNTSWGSWKTILDSSNYSSILDSRYYTESEADSRFVNVTGDTMTGRLTMTGDGIIVTTATYSNYRIGVEFYKGTTEDATYSYDAQIGWHNMGGDGTGSICILPYATSTQPWGGTVGLFITKTDLKYNGASVWHSGNDGSGSGLDADLLDGLHGSRYTRALGGPNYITITVGGDASTYYPVVINAVSDYYPLQFVNISRTYNETAPDSWNTSIHKGGLTLTLLWNGSRLWDGNGSGAVCWCVYKYESYCTMVGGLGNAVDGKVVWLRGGGATYHIHAMNGTSVTATVYTSTYTDRASLSFAPKTSVSTISVRWPGYALGADVATKVSNTLTFAAGAFAAKTYNGSAAVTVNVPTTGAHIGLGNVQNTAFYKRSTTVNGTAWDMAGTVNSAAFTIYAPTTAGTSGQVLTSMAGTPGWTNLSSLSVGYASYSGYISANSISDLNSPTTWSSDGSRLKYDVYPNSASNKPVSLDNANGVITLFKTKHGTSGQYATLIAAPNNSRLYVRYASSGSWAAWNTVAYTSDIPSVGNGTITITQGGTTKGSFTVNLSGNTTIALTDSNTDTKNTAGSTNSTSTLFLIGATSQAANPVTYSNGQVYMSNGTLYLVKTTGTAATTDNRPALIVGGAATSTHLEFDCNEIIAKSSGTAITTLYLNAGGAASTVRITESTVGSTTKGVYLSAGAITAMTYSLSATVNSGTASTLAHYSGANAISAYTSTIGSSVKPMYLNAGVPTVCNGSFNGLPDLPVVLLAGTLWRSSAGTTSTWYFTGIRHRAISSTAPTIYVSGGVARFYFTPTSGYKFSIYAVNVNHQASGEAPSHTGTEYTTRSSGLYWFGAYASGNLIYVRAISQVSQNNDAAISCAGLWNSYDDGVTKIQIIAVGYAWQI